MRNHSTVVESLVLELVHVRDIVNSVTVPMNFCGFRGVCSEYCQIYSSVSIKIHENQHYIALERWVGK